MRAGAYHDHRRQMNPRWPNGAIPRYKQSPVSGRAEPAPPRCGPSQLGWPCGGRPGSDARGRFLGGMRSARPEIRAGPKPGHVMIVGGWAKRPMAKRRRARVGVMRCLRPCGARPPQGGRSKLGWPHGENPRSQTTKSNPPLFGNGLASKSHDPNELAPFGAPSSANFNPTNCA
jgi:hypothetical protein